MWSDTLHDGLLPTTPPKEWFFHSTSLMVGNADRSSLDQNSLWTTLGGREKWTKPDSITKKIIMDDHIQTEIKRRKFVFYSVTKDELDSLTEKNIYGDISSLVASLSLSALLTGILTKQLSLNVTEESIHFLNGLIGVSIAVLILSLILAISFKRNHGKKIKEIIGEKPVQYSIKEVDEEINPDYYIGNQRIIMNIAVKHQHKFHRLYKSKAEFEKLKTNEHPNSGKKEYFTFSISNGNDKLFLYFQQFLKDCKIDYIDFK